jgi:hypothetical protein
MNRDAVAKLGCAAGFAAAALALLAGAADATAVVRVSFTGPQDVTVGASTVSFLGAASGIAAGTEADYIASIQGIPAVSLTPDGNGGHTFSVSVPIGPTPPLGGFPDGFPYIEFYTEPNRVMLPIVVELYHIPSAAVVDRDKAYFWDLRFAGNLRRSAARGITETLGVQITEAGIDALEPAHLSTLPQPDLASFNEALLSLYPAPEQSVATNTSIFSNGRVCVGLDQVPQFAATTEFRALLVPQVVAAYIGYQIARSQGAPTFNLCVKKREFFKLANYEVCVGRVDGTLTDVELQEVSAVDLAVDRSRDRLSADVSLGRVDQTVEARLRDVSIRWRQGFPTCAPRPSAPVSDASVDGSPELAALTTCAGLRADALSAATTRAIGMPFAAASDPETFDTHDAGGTEFRVPLLARDLDVGTGTCAQAFVSPDVKTLLRGYYTPLEEAFADAWLDGSPDSQHARALDLLLTTTEHGTFDAPLDHELVSLVDAAGAVALGGGTPVDGAFVRLETDAVVRPASAVVAVPQNWVHPAPIGPLPWSDDGACAHATNRDAFDVAFITTTGALNQVLRELSATARLNVSAGPALSAAVGAALAAIDPSVAPGSVQVTIDPVVAPFTWMNPDPQGRDAGFADIAYHLRDVRVTVVEVGGAGRELLRFRLDFLDPDLQLSFGADPGSDFLDASLGRMLLVATIVNHDLANLTMQPHDAKGDKSVERALEAALSLLFRPLLEETMTGLLSDYPAPQFYDAQGEATAPAQLGNKDKYQWQQYVVLYGDVL